MPPSQREMTLTTMDAGYAAGVRGGTWDVLLRFPLPGASTGGAHYVFFLHLPEPAGRSERYALGDHAVARGFFLQSRGDGRGRELIRQGWVELSRMSDHRWAMRVYARCELGTELRGEAVLRRDDFVVREFLEHRHAGDVADILGPEPSTRPGVRPRSPK